MHDEKHAETAQALHKSVRMMGRLRNGNFHRGQKYEKQDADTGDGIVVLASNYRAGYGTAGSIRNARTALAPWSQAPETGSVPQKPQRATGRQYRSLNPKSHEATLNAVLIVLHDK